MVGVVDLGIGLPDPPEVEAEPLGDNIDLGEQLLLDEPAAGGQVPHVEESMVRGLLKTAGGLAGGFVGAPEVPEHWRFTDRELDELAPPLTRYLNRNARLRAVAIRGDEAAIALVMAGYMSRNLTDAKRARRAREEHDGQHHEDPNEGPGGARGDDGGGSGAGLRDAAGAPRRPAFGGGLA